MANPDPQGCPSCGCLSGLERAGDCSDPQCYCHHLDRTEGARLKAALRAAQAAKNPLLVAAIQARLRGESPAFVDPFDEAHPEVRGHF